LHHETGAGAEGHSHSENGEFHEFQIPPFHEFRFFPLINIHSLFYHEIFTLKINFLILKALNSYCETFFSEQYLVEMH
jgi:hypothetical protein